MIRVAMQSQDTAHEAAHGRRRRRGAAARGGCPAALDGTLREQRRIVSEIEARLNQELDRFHEELDAAIRSLRDDVGTAVAVLRGDVAAATPSCGATSRSAWPRGEPMLLDDRRRQRRDGSSTRGWGRVLSVQDDAALAALLTRNDVDDVTRHFHPFELTAQTAHALVTEARR